MEFGLFFIELKLICENCGICCYKTEMLITKDDIKTILTNYNAPLKVNDFTFKNEDGYWQLKNVNKHCYFFDEKTKLCSIYKFRPEGCRYYPLIYLEDIGICSLDTDCPRRNNFYLDWRERRRTSEKLMKYLKKYNFIK